MAHDLTKAELRTNGKDLNATDVPPEHGPLETAFTSGSTGIPVKVRTPD